MILLHPFEVEDLFHPGPSQVGAWRHRCHSDECRHELSETPELCGCLRARIDGVTRVRIRRQTEPTDSRPPR